MKSKRTLTGIGLPFIMAASMACCASLQAALVIYEPFAQTAGGLNNVAASTIGLSGNWTAASINVTSPSLVGSTGNPPTSGNRALSTTTVNNKAYATVSSALSSAGLLANGSELWFSVLVRSINPGRTYVMLGTGPADGYDRVGTTQAGGNNGYGLGVKLENGKIFAHTYLPSGAITGTGTTVADGIYLVVGRINWGASAGMPTALSIYLPDSTLALPATAASSIATAVFSQSTFNTVSFAAMNSTTLPIPEVDEIRFGATYQDVVGVTPTYWDLNTTTAGSGGPTPSGTWDATTANWNTDATGGAGGTIAAWAPGLTAVFAAGTDATGGYTVSVNGTPQFGSLSFVTGAATLSGGGVLNFGSGGGAVDVRQSGMTAVVATPLSQTTTGASLYKEGSGALVLAGNNTYTCPTIVDAGTLVLSGTNSAATGNMTINNNAVTRFDSLNAINGTTRNVTVNAGGAVWFGPSFAATDIPSALLNRIVASSAGVIAADSQAATAFNFNTAALTAASLGAIGNVSYTGTLTPKTLYRLGGGGGTLIMANQYALIGSSMTLTVSGPGMVVLSNQNLYTGTTTLNVGGTLVIGHPSALGTGGLTASGTGTATVQAAGTISIGNAVSANSTIFAIAGTSPLTFNGTVTLGASTTTLSLSTGPGIGSVTTKFGIITGSNRNLVVSDDGNAAVSGNMTFGTGTMTKNGAGTLTLSGANTFTGATTLNAGTLTLDYSTQNNSKLSSTTALALNGATLNLSAGSTAQAVLSTTLNTGGSFIKQTGSGTSKLLMGAITFTGGALDFSAANIATTTSANANGILSQRATVAGADFAMGDGASPANIVAYDYVTSGTTGYAGEGMVGNWNYAMVGSGTTTLTASTGDATDTLKITTTGTGEFAVGANTLTLGTLLFAGANDYAISTSGGQIVPGLLLNYGGGKLTLGALGGPLTQFGTGTTILSANAASSYALTIHGGTVQLTSNLQIGTATATVITLNNGTLLADATGGDIALDSNNGGGSNARTVTLSAGGGTLDVLGANKLTVSGVISGTGPLTLGHAGATGTIALTAVLSGASQTSTYNTYSGNTIIKGGTVSFSSPNPGQTAAAVTIAATGATLNLNYTGTETVKQLFVGSTQMPAGVYGASGSAAPIIGIAQITGTGTLTVTCGPGTPDTTAPTPNPMTFATAPAAVDRQTITMTATSASDPSGPVQYYFANTTIGSHDSGWQDSPIYTDTGLSASTTYAYTVKARDAYGNQTAASAPASATTLAAPIPPSVLSIVDNKSGGPIGGNVLVTYTVTFNEAMDASTVTDASKFSNAGTALTTIGPVSQVTPSVFTVQATPTGGGTLRLQINAGVTMKDLADDASLDTTSAIPDDTTITVDATPPTLLPIGIVDNQSGGPVLAGLPVTYTVTFSKAMMASTVVAASFGNAGTATFSVGTVSQTSANVFSVPVTPSGAGTLILQVNQNAVLTDLVGNPLDTTSAILDDTTITVNLDTAAPTPDPMTWASAPAAVTSTLITMTATTATDPSGVQYYFTNTVNGQVSGWQDSPTYTEIGLSPGTAYAYEVKARDKSFAFNETSFSLPASASTAPAATSPLIYEPFAMASIGGTPVGTGLAGNWTVTGIGITPGSLAWGSLPTSGNHALATGTYGQAWALTGTTLSGAGLLTGGAELWFSALVQSVNPGRTYVTIGNGAADGFDRVGSSGIGVKLENGNLYAHYWDGAAAHGGAAAVVSDGVHLVVGKITWGATGTANDTLSIYLPDTDLALPSVPASTLTMVVNQSTFTNISFAGMNSTAVPEVDEIRFGGSYASVLAGLTPPEPAFDPGTGYTVVGGNPSLTFTATAGYYYRIVWSADATLPFNTPWLPVVNTGGSPATDANGWLKALATGPMTLVDPAGTAALQRFYVIQASATPTP